MRRVIDLSSKSYLSVKNSQLIIQRDEHDDITAPFEDIDVIILGNPQTTLTQSVLNECINNNVAVVFCDSKFIPSGLVLPYHSHTTQTKIIEHQSNIHHKLKNKIWKAIVQSKITNQNSVLSKNYKEKLPLKRMLSDVDNNGDSKNIEAQAAKIYFKILFGDNFIRDRDAEGTNSFLNYGYAIIRSMVARSISRTGLHPALGVHHKSQYDPFPLASDFMEPIRPFLDDLIFNYINIEKNQKINTDIKRKITKIITYPCLMNDNAMTLQTAIPIYISSLKKVITKEDYKINTPKLMI